MGPIPKNRYQWAVVLVRGWSIERIAKHFEFGMARDSPSNIKLNDQALLTGLGLDKESGSMTHKHPDHREGVVDAEGPVPERTKPIPIVGTSKGQNINVPDKHQIEWMAKEIGKEKGKGKEEPR